MKLFLDACVLVRLSNGGQFGPLVGIAAVRPDVKLITSRYALNEALRRMSKTTWPSKATIAALATIGNMVLTDMLHVRLAYPTAAEVDANLAICEDPEDVPIILDAVAENCDFIVTDDKRLRRSKSPIPCVRPLDLIDDFQEQIRTVAASLGLSEVAAAEAPGGSSPEAPPEPVT